MSCASIPTHIVESKGHSFSTILILCGSCIVEISTGFYPEGIPGLTNSVADVASCSSVVSTILPRYVNCSVYGKVSSSPFTWAGS